MRPSNQPYGTPRYLLESPFLDGEAVVFPERRVSEALLDEELETALRDDEAPAPESEAADTTLVNDHIYVDPEYVSDAGDKAPEVWAHSDLIRALLKQKGHPDEKSRTTLTTAVTRQLSTVVLHLHLAQRTVAAGKGEKTAQPLTLYTLLFPSEARDNTGIKDLNDKVLGATLNTKYIRLRHKAINSLYWIEDDDTFVVVGNDYKTSTILTWKAPRQEFAKRLRKLDAKLRTILLDEILPEAERGAQGPEDKERLKAIKALQRALLKDKNYRFDIFFGLAALRTDAKPTVLEAVYLLVTEALKGAALAKLIAKGSSARRKEAQAITKGMKPDPKDLDPRGKQYDEKLFLAAATASSAIKKFVTRTGGTVEYVSILVDKVWTVAFLQHRRWFVGHPDVVRDVRKKLLVKPTLKDGVRYNVFPAQKELLELWLVILNMMDYVKDFLAAEFRQELARYHMDALAAFVELRRRPIDRAPIDWQRLERVLTHDLRQRRISVLGTASEFQFFSEAADYSERVFFMMDMRDLGVWLMLVYDQVNEDMEHTKPGGVKLMETTFKAADPVNRLRRYAHDRVIRVFKKYYDDLNRQPVTKLTEGSRKAFGKSRVGGAMPRFDHTIQVMLGGDEVMVAAHPYYAPVAHAIVNDLAVGGAEQALDMRTAVAFSRAGGDPPKRDDVQDAHHRAMTLADHAPRTLKELERTHRRIERLIDKLEENPKKKDLAPPFRNALDALALRRVFARIAHGKAAELTPARFRRLFRLLRAGDLTAAEKSGYLELVNFAGQVVDIEKLEADWKRLEQKVKEKVWPDNTHVEPPPVTQMPKWMKKVLDCWADGEDLLACVLKLLPK